MTVLMDASTELPMTETGLLLLVLGIGVTVGWLWLLYR